MPNLDLDCQTASEFSCRPQAQEQRLKTLPEGSLGQAINYMLNPGYWPSLTLFLSDPRIPIDNNWAERGLRGVVVGRKNHYGSRSRRGIEVASLFYSIIETCKLVDAEPKAYLRAAVLSKLRDGVDFILPHQFAAQQAVAALAAAQETPHLLVDPLRKPTVRFCGGQHSGPPLPHDAVEHRLLRLPPLKSWPSPVHSPSSWRTSGASAVVEVRPPRLNPQPPRPAVRHG